MTKGRAGSEPAGAKRLHGVCQRKGCGANFAPDRKIDLIDNAKLKPLDLNALQPPMNVTLVTNAEGLSKLKSFLDSTKGQPLGFDTETNVVQDFYFRKARTLQIGNKTQQFVIDLLAFAGSEEKLCESQGNYKLDEVYRPIFNVLTPVLESKDWLKVGAYLSFDYTVLRWNFGISMWHLFSTDLAERVIQAGAISLKKASEFSMQSIVARRFGVLVDKEKQTSFDLKTPLTEEQIQYAAFDVRMPLSIREHQLREATRDGLLSTIQIENDALPAYCDMSLNGLLIDCDKWKVRIDAVVKQREEDLRTLDETFIPVVGRKTEQIDLEELSRREEVWRKGFEIATPEEMNKAEEIRSTRDNTKKAELRAELEVLKKARLALKAEARRSYSELSKKNTEFKKALPKMEGEAALNYSSNEQLLSALKQIKGFKSLESSADEDLLKFNDRPFIQILRRYRKGKKDSGTYGLQWTQQWIQAPSKVEGWRHPWDGRIHPQWNPCEAQTGRSSSQKPSVMNLPKDDQVRACFCASEPTEEEPEGFVLVTCDMSGAELRILAELSQAKSWLQAFSKGHDVHSCSTEILRPVEWRESADKDCAYYKLDEDGEPQRQKCNCKVHKELRDATKSLNFLLVYGGGKDKLADQLGITVDAAGELMHLHEEKFPDIWAFLKRTAEDAQRTKESRDLYGRRLLFKEPTWEDAKELFKEEKSERLELPEAVKEKNVFDFKVKYFREPTELELYQLTHRPPSESEIRQSMRSMYGRIGRQAKNFPMQATNVSLAKRVMSAGFDSLGKGYLWHLIPQLKARQINFVHDELVIETVKRNGQEVLNCVIDAIHRAGQEVLKGVTMEAEGRISNRWQK